LANAWASAWRKVVAVICPGFVRTPMNAGIRPGLPLTMSAERAAAIIQRGLTPTGRAIAFRYVCTSPFACSAPPP
jgi:NAD(P)-dependent dehydrogenase (short-subunit alcohol dehydrogenase family)